MKEYDGFLVDDDLNIYSKRTGRKLSPFVGSDGYLSVGYRTGEGKKSHKNRVHVIFAHCFIPNPNNYKYVNHIDSNKLNNNLDNLEWCTNSYNVYHGWHSGNRTHKNNTSVEVRKIDDNELVGIYKSIRECAKKLHLDRHKIARVLKGELRKDYLGYLFNYSEGQETIENISQEKDLREEVSRVHLIWKIQMEVPSIDYMVTV